MKVKKILHITGVRELGSGQRKQLSYEYNSAKEFKSIQWDVLAIHSGDVKNIFETKIPFYLDFIIIRNLYFWLVAFKLRKKYDLILFRYLMFDPFAFIFAPLISNRISVHHSKEIEELKLIRKGLKGKIASFIERITGKFSIKKSLYIAAVTKEIALYENEIRNVNKEILVYPNGIDINSFSILPDHRQANVVNILFMCSYFSEWHGLDILLDSLNKYTGSNNFFIHLVGNVTSDQKNEIINNRYNNNIICYGSKKFDEYFAIASKCDVGLGSLAMFRQNLNEGSTLKVREMLAMGLPVYSGHKDVSFDNSFDYYRFSSKFNFINLLDFANSFKSIDREKVRSSALCFIDKKSIMEKLIEEINSLNQNKL